MKRNFSPAGVALFSFRRWHWLRGLRCLLRRSAARSKRGRAADERTEKRATIEVCSLETRESVV
jgi:hypothetical protein